MPLTMGASKADEFIPILLENKPIPITKKRITTINGVKYFPIKFNILERFNTNNKTNPK